MKQPIYNILNDSVGASLSKEQLEEVLAKIPLQIEIRTGHDLPLVARIQAPSEEEPILNVQSYARMIVLKPQAGKRISDAYLNTRAFTQSKILSDTGLDAQIFVQSRLMDECTGGGACCSYQFNTKNLGLPFSIDMTLDIHKLG